MNPKYTLKNFRVFDSEGATFELAPITILTGPNGSGKSSISKSLQMMKTINLLTNNIVDLSIGEHQLGRFDKLTNWESGEDEIIIEFSYQSFLLPLHSNLNIKITLRNEDKQKPYEAKIASLDIFTKNGEMLYHCDRPNSRALMGATMNFGLIKEDIIQRVKEWQKLYVSAITRQCIDEDYLLYRIGGHDIIMPILTDYIKNAQKIGTISKKLINQCIPSEVRAFEETEFTTYGVNDNPLIYCYMDSLLNLRECTNSPAFIKTGIIYDFDIIHTLDTLRKDEIYQFLYERIKDIIANEGYKLSAYRDTFIQDLKEMVEDYIHSPYSLFSQYYKHLEDEFVKKYNNFLFPSILSDVLLSRYVFTFEEFKEASELSKSRESLEEALRGTPQEEWKSVQHDKKWEIVKSQLKKIGLENKINYGSIEIKGQEKQLEEIYNTSFSQQKNPRIKFILTQYLLSNWWFPSLGKDEIKINNNIQFIELYYKSILNEIFSCSDFLKNSEYISGIRSNSRRLYSFDDQGDLSKVLFRYLRLESGEKMQRNGSASQYAEKDWWDGSTIEINTKRDLNYLKGTFLKQSLKMLLDIDDVRFESDPEGVGVYIKLIKTINGKKREILLADMGYGNTPLLSMLLQIEIAIRKSLEQNKEMRHSLLNGFYAFDNYLTRTTICIEEPETNLHPAVQSRLADVFKLAAEKYPVNFILETHSEYLIRRSQVIVAEAKYKDTQELAQKCPFRVYYLPEAGTGKPYEMEFMPTGGFKNSFGEGFFDEAGKLDMIVLRNESSLKRR